MTTTVRNAGSAVRRSLRSMPSTCRNIIASAMPEADSTNTVFDDADPSPPATAPAPSTTSALPTFGS